jgi:thiol-disulfide isomerase/thioredoxin
MARVTLARSGFSPRGPRRPFTGRGGLCARLARVAPIIVGLACAGLTSGVTAAPPGGPILSPDLVLTTLDGSESLRLETLRGYPVVMSFWASWCAPCREELPELAALAVELGDQGFFLVAVNVDQSPAVGEQFLRRHRIAVPAFRVARADLVRIGIDGLPTTIVLDADGHVVQVFKGFTRSLIGQIRRRVEAMHAAGEDPPGDPGP